MSIEIIVTYAVKGILLITSIVLYVYLFSVIIPKGIMRIKLKYQGTCDRGLKKFIYPNGRCVLYEPELLIRKYIPLYALYTEDGYKYLKCKATERVSYLRYDVYAFDNRNKLIDIIGVAEAIGADRYTDNVSLPPATSYVRLVVRGVDNEYFSNRVLLRYSFVGYLLCALVVAVATAFESMLMCMIVKDILVNALAIRIDFLGNIAMMCASVAVALIVACLTVLAYRRNCKKVINR